MKYDLIVTRHQGLVEYLRAEGIVSDDTPVLSHVTEENVREKSVIGVLPVSLAAAAASLTVIPLDVPEGVRGWELDEDGVRKYARAPETFDVRRV